MVGSEGKRSVTKFQFTPLREGRQRRDRAGYRRPHFNSRPSARGDPILSAIWCNTAYFNSRPSARGDMVRRCRCWSTLAISIHAPPRGATRGDATRKKVAIFQFTPLREGRLRSHRVKAINYYFNSRPSARGDNTLIGLRVTHDDFNSRPSARGDLVGKCAHGAQNNFNSRPSARGDRKRNAPDRCTRLISIHAPPRGATRALASY